MKHLEWAKTMNCLIFIWNENTKLNNTRMASEIFYQISGALYFPEIQTICSDIHLNGSEKRPQGILYKKSKVSV